MRRLSSRVARPRPSADSRSLVASSVGITHVLACGNRQVDYTVRISDRARWMRLTIRPDTGPVVTVPRRYHAADLREFLRRHQRWILRHVDRLARVAPGIPRRWPYGSTLPYLGEDRRVLVESCKGPSTVTRLDEPALLVRMPHPSIAGARQILRRWYRDEAARVLTERVTMWALRIGIPWRSLAVRHQRRRWGSCSETGRLSFNYRLVMAPIPILDYVILHELMHRRELNHSPRFWDLVRAHCPAYRDACQWLKHYGPYLSV